MAIARVIEITASSPDSFDDAVRRGIERASSTLKGVEAAWVQEQTVRCEGGKVTEFRVNMKVSFVMDDGHAGDE